MNEIIKAAKRLADSCNYRGSYDCEHCPYAETTGFESELVIFCSRDYIADVRTIADYVLNKKEDGK